MMKAISTTLGRIMCLLGMTALVSLSIPLLVLSGAPAPPYTLEPRDSTPPAVIDTPDVPIDVIIPAGFPANQNPIAFFDDYSWRTFIALVWPALKDQRGEPDKGPMKTVGSDGPRVFETYKALWELFHPDGSAPVGWNSFEDKKFNPCGVDTAWGDLTLGSFSKFGDLGQAGVGSLVGPLIAQPAAHPTYVRFLTGFNKSEFDFILNPDGAATPKPLYMRINLEAAKPVRFKNGALDVKSAWMDMTDAAHPERYYTRKAWVLDPGTGNSSQITVGLVGLHIVQKTPSRPQWIWTTFEHVDNVPPTEPGAPGTLAFNDGTATAMPTKNPFTVSPLPIPTPAPYNVTRIKPIHDSTAKTNAAYRMALKDTIWKNYQLVMTQWPLKPNSDDPGIPKNTFPGLGSDQTAFANTTMETFDQSKVVNGCMNCHNFTRLDSDFLWSLEDHAFPTTQPGFLMKKASFRGLRSLMSNRKP